MRKPRSREDALKMMDKRAKKIENGNEEKLQAEMIVDFAKHTTIDKHKRLFATFQNSDNGHSGGLMVAMGLKRGVSDLIYIDDSRRIVAIEVKDKVHYHSAKHVVEQAEWIRDNCYRGGFCNSISMMWDIIEGRSNGIDAQSVIDYISRTQCKSIRFDKDCYF